ncbi:MAG: hypothetical protein A2857_03190 [Candidatus Levybacteria bacterium RIFCSPHIGHO2_01_FULL_36_15]|nr:MAG: hypothetical protein A2857_03190 [Candidatus Levybacteria bacterium RIFCSPHIGHO2_01_FULL_36_15]OGH38253.1 MAG: hypothetical protein A2905_03420 [Candidatus Levybacteria bacterium RIFCSPLOWO2_01_FULL_36_10]
MKKIGIIGGIPGSGKSSVGKQLRQKGISVFEIDELYPDLPGEERWATFKDQFEKLVKEGREGVFIGSFRIPNTRKEFLEIAEKHGYGISGLFFDLDPKLVTERIKKRSGEDSSHRMSKERYEESVQKWNEQFSSQDNKDLEYGPWTVVKDPEITPVKLADEMARHLNWQKEFNIEGYLSPDQELARR